MEDSIPCLLRRRGLAIVKGQGIGLVLDDDAGFRECLLLFRYRLEPCATAVLRLVHDPF